MLIIAVCSRSFALDVRHHTVPVLLWHYSSKNPLRPQS